MRGGKGGSAGVVGRARGAWREEVHEVRNGGVSAEGWKSAMTIGNGISATDTTEATDTRWVTDVVRLADVRRVGAPGPWEAITVVRAGLTGGGRSARPGTSTALVPLPGRGVCTAVVMAPGSGSCEGRRRRPCLMGSWVHWPCIARRPPQKSDWQSGRVSAPPLAGAAPRSGRYTRIVTQGHSSSTLSDHQSPPRRAERLVDFLWFNRGARCSRWPRRAGGRTSAGLTSHYSVVSTTFCTGSPATKAPT